MSSTIWTPNALRSEASKWSGGAWRLVEAQHEISTRKLVEDVREQEILDAILDQSKPPVPPDCSHLDFLLFTPFRYGPYPNGSRFRRAGMTPGVFYAAEHYETAVAEMAYYRMQFYRDSPDTRAPDNAANYTAIKVAVETPFALDLTEPPFAAHEPVWTDENNYGPCQAFADVAREAGIEVILSRSVRDPKGRKNVNVLTCRAFSKSAPTSRQSWRIIAGEKGATAYCQSPGTVLEFAA